MATHASTAILAYPGQRGSERATSSSRSQASWRSLASAPRTIKRQTTADAPAKRIEMTSISHLAAFDPRRFFLGTGGHMHCYSKTTLAIAAILVIAPAYGAQRTFVSTSGVNNPACSLVAPCRDFGAAIAATSSGGEVVALNSGGYGAVTITQSVAIIAPPGVYAGISAFSGDGVTINGAGINVVLRGLSINGLPGANGINVTNGASVKVESCEIAGFTTTNSAGIKVATPAVVTVVDSVIRGNWNGMWFDNGATGDVSRTTVVGNLYVGIWAFPTVSSTVSVTVTDTMSSNNNWGFVAIGNPLQIGKMTLSRSTASHNAASGFQTEGSGQALMLVSGSVASGNGNNGFTNFAGTLRSLVDNTVFDNALGDTSGAITATAPQ